MKEFIRTILATITGVLITGFICFILCVAVFTSILTSSTSETTIRKNSIFVLNIEGNLIERYSPSPIDQLLGEEATTYGLEDILKSIEKAQYSNDIKGIYLNIKSCDYPPASLKAIRNALQHFRQTGKFIIAYGGNYSQNGYYLASVADKVIVNPSGSIMWHGLSAQTLFFTDLLQKAGIKMQIFRVGTYKSAIEPFIHTEMSEANRNQTQAYIQSIWNSQLADISSSRNLSVEKLNTLADQNMSFQNAQVCIENGLADTLMYKDETLSYLKSLVGCKETDQLATMTLDEMIYAKSPRNNTKSLNKIAIYYAYGEIDNGMGYSGEGINSEQMAKDLSQLREDDNIKAVVLRINSPGGSAYGAEQIWREVSLLKSKKPVVVSMGDYAASGGYYIACPANIIVASPSTITGSIGIFGILPDASELLTDKLSLHWDGVKTNRLADMGSLYRPLNDEEKALIQQSVNEGYKLFTKRCAEGRNMPLEELEKIAEGRVWTGEMAKELNLVDALGDLDTAIAYAEKLSQASDYQLVSYPEKEDILSTFLNNRTHHYIHAQIKHWVGNEYFDSFLWIKNAKQNDFMQARLPFNLHIH